VAVDAGTNVFFFLYATNTTVKKKVNDVLVESSQQMLDCEMMFSSRFTVSGERDITQQ
jgi:hypothetical protein